MSTAAQADGSGRGAWTSTGVPAWTKGGPEVVQKTLTSGQVGIVLGYLHADGKHKGEPDRPKVYRMARAGLIPPAINADKLPCIDWRWSPALLDAFIAGEWKPETLKPVPTRRRAS